MAALRQCARLLRLHVGPSRQEAVVHGPGIRPDQRMELRRGLALAAARLLATPGAPGVGARSQSALSRNAGALCARLPVARADGGAKRSTPTRRSTAAPTSAISDLLT